MAKELIELFSGGAGSGLFDYLLPLIKDRLQQDPSRNDIAATLKTDVEKQHYNALLDNSGSKTFVNHKGVIKVLSTSDAINKDIRHLFPSNEINTLVINCPDEKIDVPVLERLAGYTLSLLQKMPSGCSLAIICKSEKVQNALLSGLLQTPEYSPDKPLPELQHVQRLLLSHGNEKNTYTILEKIIAADNNIHTVVISIRNRNAKYYDPFLQKMTAKPRKISTNDNATGSASDMNSSNEASASTAATTAASSTSSVATVSSASGIPPSLGGKKPASQRPVLPPKQSAVASGLVAGGNRAAADDSTENLGASAPQNVVDISTSTNEKPVDPALAAFLAVKSPQEESSIQYDQIFTFPLPAVFTTLFENISDDQEPAFDDIALMARESPIAAELIDTRAGSWYSQYQVLHRSLITQLRVLDVAKNQASRSQLLLQQHRKIHQDLVNKSYDKLTAIGSSTIGSEKSSDQELASSSITPLEQLRVELALQQEVLARTENDVLRSRTQVDNVEAEIRKLFEMESQFVNAIRGEGYSVIRGLFSKFPASLTTRGNIATDASVLKPAFSEYEEYLKSIYHDLSTEITNKVTQKKLSEIDAQLCTTLLIETYGCVIYQLTASNETLGFQPIVIDKEVNSQKKLANDSEWLKFVTELKKKIDVNEVAAETKEKFGNEYVDLQKTLKIQLGQINKNIEAATGAIEKGAVDIDATTKQLVATPGDTTIKLKLERLEESQPKMQAELQRYKQEKLNFAKSKHEQRWKFLTRWNNSANHTPLAPAVNAAANPVASSELARQFTEINANIKLISPYRDPLAEFKRNNTANNVRIDEFHLTSRGLYTQSGVSLEDYLDDTSPKKRIAIFPLIQPTSTTTYKYKIVINPRRGAYQSVPLVKTVETNSLKVILENGMTLGESVHSISVLPDETKQITIESKTKLTDKVNATTDVTDQRQNKFTSSFSTNLQNELSTKDNMTESDKTVQSEKLIEEQKRIDAESRMTEDATTDTDSYGKSSSTNRSSQKSKSSGLEMSNTASSSTGVGVKVGVPIEGAQVDLNAGKEWNNGSSTVRGTGKASSSAQSYTGQTQSQNQRTTGVKDTQKADTSRESALNKALSTEGEHMSSQAREVVQKNISNKVSQVASETSSNNTVHVTNSSSREFTAETLNREVITLKNPNIGRTVTYTYFQVKNIYATKNVCDDVKIVICMDSGVDIGEAENLVDYRVVDIEDFNTVYSLLNSTDYAALVAAAVANLVLTQYFPLENSKEAQKNMLTLHEDDVAYFDKTRIDCLREPQPLETLLTENSDTDIVKLIELQLKNIRQALLHLQTLRFKLSPRELGSVQRHAINSGALYVDAQLGQNPAIEPYLMRHREIDLEAKHAEIAYQRAQTTRIQAQARYIDARAAKAAFFQPLPNPETLVLRGGTWQSATAVSAILGDAELGLEMTQAANSTNG